MSTKQNLNRAWLPCSTDMLPCRLVSETVFASTQHCSNQKAIRQDHSQDRSNLVAKYDGRAGEPAWGQG